LPHPAATASSASRFVSVNGFPQNTCLRPPAAATTCAPCSECGVARTIASASRSARTASYFGSKRKPCCLAKASISGVTVRVAPATKRIASLFAADSTSVLPHQPSPTMAALIIGETPLRGVRELALAHLAVVHGYEQAADR